MMTTSTSPEMLRSAVFAAVQDGAWATADVVAAVATDYNTDRGAIVATLWDLVDEGLLRFDGCPQCTGFRPC